MRAKITLTGVGVGGIKGLGVNVGTAAYIQIGERIVTRYYGVADYLSLGDRSHTLGIGHIDTAFFHLGDTAYNKLINLSYLQGKRLEIEAKGTLLVRGHIDLSLRLIDEKGVGEAVLERFGILATGAQFATTQVRGRVRLIPAHLYPIKEAAT